MSQESKSRKERDYSPEVIGFIALTFLSAMSHFWYPLIATSILFALSSVIAVIAKLALPQSPAPGTTTGSDFVTGKYAG